MNPMDAKARGITDGGCTGGKCVVRRRAREGERGGDDPRPGGLRGRDERVPGGVVRVVEDDDLVAGLEAHAARHGVDPARRVHDERQVIRVRTHERGKVGAGTFVETVWGIGYKANPDIMAPKLEIAGASGGRKLLRHRSPAKVPGTFVEHPVRS